MTARSSVKTSWFSQQKELDYFQQPDFGLASTGAHPWVARFPGYVEGSAISENSTSSTCPEHMVRFAVVLPDEQFACPCCGHLTLDEPPPGTWLICDVCEWEDDPVQFDDIDYEGGANPVSLRQAREFYRTIGMSSPERLRTKQLSDPHRLPK